MAVPVAASSVVPVFVAGNPTCADLGFDNELKIDPPKAGVFDVNGGTVTISNIDTSVNPATFTWSSSGVTIAAVSVKGGNGGQGEGANVYYYNPPPTTSDTGLHAANGFSHINICWNDQPPPAKGSLKITKVVTGAPEGFEGSFDVTVNCGEAGTFGRTISYPTPGFVTIDDILAGAQCSVVETDKVGPPAGMQWGQAQITGSPATIVSNGTADVTVTNHLTQLPPGTGSLKVTKDIPNVPGDFTGSFDVRVTCTDGDPINRTISFPDPGFITVDGLPAGALCAVIETGRSDPPAGLQWAGSLFAGTATIVADQTAAITVTNLLAEQNAVTPPPEVPTPPPTDSAVQNGTSSSGFSLLIVTLLMLAAAGGILAFAPTAASIRKRKR